MLRGIRALARRGAPWVLLAALGACVSSEPRRLDGPPDIETSVFDPVPPGDGVVHGPLVWGFGQDPEAAPVAPEVEDQDPETQDREREEAGIRARFGSTVLIGPDGRVTKQFFLAGELGQVFLKLITKIEAGQQFQPQAQPPEPGFKVGGPEAKSILGRMLGGREIEVTYIPEFEEVNGVEMFDPKTGLTRFLGAPLTPSSNPNKIALLLITALPSALATFEDAFNLFYSSIPQIEITVQVIEFQRADALAFGVLPIDETTPVFQNLNSKQLIQAFTADFPLRQPVVGTDPVTDVGLLTLGGIHDSWQLNAVLQALEANNLADVTSSPKLVVRNGGTATISTVTEIPFPKARITQSGANVATDINFKPVGVTMTIVPVIAGTDSVILQVHADVSAVTGFVGTDVVQTPVTSQRSALTSVHLKNNHSLVIGGLTSESEFETESKVPILGDIPILGFLFRSTSKTRQETEVAFQITPRIVRDRGLRTDTTGF